LVPIPNAYKVQLIESYRCSNCDL